jgi:NADH:ubiquinone oxidoreductase subunit 6 (subunit J)
MMNEYSDMHIPTKWKVFKVLTFLLTTVTFICLILSTIGFLQEKDFIVSNIIVYLTYFFIFSLFIFHFISLQLIFSHYPSKAVSTFKATVLGIVSILAILVCVFVLYTLFSGFNDYEKIHNSNTKTGYFIFLFFLVCYFLLLTYSIIYTHKLKKCIQKNVTEAQEQVIDSIGSK